MSEIRVCVLVVATGYCVLSRPSMSLYDAPIDEWYYGE